MSLGSRLVGRTRGRDRAQLGVFMVLIMAAIALVVVSIVLLFGIDLAGSFAEPLLETDGEGEYTHAYGEQAEATSDSTGDAFELFGTSVLVIPAAAVLAVLIGGLVGAISMRGGLPGMNGNGGGRPGRRR